MHVMDTIAILFTVITALLHGYFFILETFLWTTPFGLKTFRMSPEKAEASRVLAANQGVYNGFLALGLLLTFFMHNPEGAIAVRSYCLSFIVIVGCYGAYSLRSQKVFLIQALPALIALIFSS